MEWETYSRAFGNFSGSCQSSKVIITSTPTSTYTDMRAGPCRTKIKAWYKGCLFDMNLEKEEMDFFFDAKLPTEEEFRFFKVIHPETYDTIKSEWEKKSNFKFFTRG